MAEVILQALIILLLMLANAVFAMAEMAVVSARRPRLQQRAEEGSSGARAALELAEHSTRFLSTVQIGITLIGILNGALGGTTLGVRLARVLATVPVLAPYSGVLGFVIVVVVITYLSLLIGELVPKRLALNNAEAAAIRLAPLMLGISSVVSPAVSFLSRSTDLVLRLLGVHHVQEPSVTEEEVRTMIEEGAQAGVFEEAEQEIVERVFELSDRRVVSLMTPRTEVVWLDLQDPAEELERKIAESPYSMFPVADGDLDNVLGTVKAKDLLARLLQQQPLDLRAALQPALFLPEAMPAFEALERFKEYPASIALVIDEYGGVQGLVTVTDILEAIVGDIAVTGEQGEKQAVQREDGSWLLDGMLPVSEFKEILGIEQDLPGEEEGFYQTLGGFVMANLGRVPSSGDHFECCDYRFEVVDMDERRVDKVLAVPLPAKKAAAVPDGEPPA